MDESTWKKAIVDHLCRPTPPPARFRLWQQQAGEIIAARDARKRRIVMAPEGAADLVGTGPHGVHIEIEVKVDEPWKDNQRNWCRKTHNAGAIYIVARWDKRLSLWRNLAQLEEALADACRTWAANLLVELSR